MKKFTVLMNGEYFAQFDTQAKARAYVRMQLCKMRGAGLAPSPDSIREENKAFAAKQQWMIQEKEVENSKEQEVYGYWGVAQQVESLTLNQVGASSNPAASAKENNMRRDVPYGKCEFCGPEPKKATCLIRSPNGLSYKVCGNHAQINIISCDYTIIRVKDGDSWIKPQ